MTNPLYPAFFRLDQLLLLVVGAGNVGEEKLRFILKSSPNANVIIVAPEMGEELRTLLEGYQRSAFGDAMARSQVQGPKPSATAESPKAGQLQGRSSAESSGRKPGQSLRSADESGRSSPVSADERKLWFDLMATLIPEGGEVAGAADFLKDDGSGQFDADKLRAAGNVQICDTYYTFGDNDALAGLYFTPEGGSVIYLKRKFQPEDVESADLVIAATELREVNQAVYDAAKQHRRLCNIADTPDLCDFYLGSIVTRGPLKIAISTNGQSPTFAKRFRQFLEAELPELETTNLLDNLKLIRIG